MRPHPAAEHAVITPSKAAPALALLVAALAVAVPVEAQHGSTSNLGSVDFGVTCEPAVRDSFDRAVALLHHMMYQEARSAFEKIAEREPGCAMAHWGIAATLFQPLWPARPDLEERRRGWKAIQRAQELGPGTERERALVAATAAFFEDPEADEWWPRIERWSDALETAYRQRPDDTEIGAFYGLSILAAGQTSDDQLAHNARAAEVLTDIHERARRHPGAIHYTIHADDASGRAEEHLEVVEAYSGIAPDVPHSLHMPSHIYVRLGDWQEVIEWNERSAEAALERSTDERVSLHHVHALDYLLYAHLQRGDDASAAAVLRDRLVDDRPYQEDFVSAYHLAVMPARYAVERRAWAEAAAIEPGEPDYLGWSEYEWPLALSWFARGLGAVHSGDLATAREAEARMQELRRQARDRGEETFATRIEIDRLILAGWIAHAGGEAGAVERMREAGALEETVEKDPVSPGSLVPPREALGDLLMELDRPDDALVAYESSLDVWPHRYRSLLGAARAAREAGRDGPARDHYSRLLDLVEGTGSDRPGVAEAEAVVTSGR